MLHLIAGHGHGDCGSVGYGYTEAERVRALCVEIKRLGGDRVNYLDASRDWYADAGILSLDIPKTDFLLEVHLDASVPSAMGGHVIIWEGFKPDGYDNALANFISGFFPGRSEKIVPRGDLANPRRAMEKGINYRLIECCFITNQSDLTKFNNNLTEIAKGILNAFGINVTNAKPSSNPSQAIDSAKSFDKSFAKTYTVDSYDGILELKPKADENSVSIAQMKSGDKFTCYGYYTKEDDGTIWLCGTTQINGKQYTGYASKYFLK